MRRRGFIILGLLVAGILVLSFFNWQQEQKFNTIISFDACVRAAESAIYYTDAWKICQISYRASIPQSKRSRRAARGGARNRTTRVFFERSPDDIFLTSPVRGLVPSPVCVAGRARENWFIKNEVRVRVYNQKGLTIGEATADRGHKYADGFYEFKTKVPFTTDEPRIWVALARDDPKTAYGIEVVMAAQVEKNPVLGVLGKSSNISSCF